MMEHWNVDNSWTLFLDRDGVINKRLMGDYVKRLDEFEFNEGALEAIANFAQRFGKIVVVTNQQGIGKGLMTHEDLSVVHEHMMAQIEQAGGRIDRIYYCPELAQDNPKCRKPEIGMALSAQEDFPQIDLNKSIVVGDSVSDMEFGKNAGMKRVFVTCDDAEKLKTWDSFADAAYLNLSEFSKVL